MRLIPDEANGPIWIRFALTPDQIKSLPELMSFRGTAEVQYVSKHEVGERSNVEIRIKEFEIGGANV